MNLNTIRFYSRAIKSGSKYVYQTVPRLLTLWLDSGEDDPELQVESNLKINQEVSKAIGVIPTYKVCYMLSPILLCSCMHLLVVHGLPSDCFTCGPWKQAGLQAPCKLDFSRDRGISKASTLVIHICRQVDETNPSITGQETIGSVESELILCP